MRSVPRKLQLPLALVTITLVVVAVFGGAGAAVATVAWGLALPACIVWRVRRGETPERARGLLLPFCVANGAWLASYLAALQTSSATAGRLSDALLVAGTLLFGLIIVRMARLRRGSGDVASALDAIAFLAALAGPLWFGLVQPAGAPPELLLTAAMWLVLLGTGSMYVLGAGVWNVPAALFAAGVVINIGLDVVAHVLTLPAAEPAAATPIFLGGFIAFTFAIMDADIGPTFDAGHRPDGVSLNARVWMMPACVAAPLACVSYAYVQGQEPPILLAGVLLATMFGVLATRAWLLARAKAPSWHVPITISFSTFIVGIAALALASFSDTAQEARDRATHLGAAVPIVAELDGVMLRATIGVGAGERATLDEAQRQIARLTAIDVARHPEVATAIARYRTVAERALTLQRAGRPAPAEAVARLEVRPAQVALLATVRDAASAEDRGALASAARTRALSVAALLGTLVVVTTLLMRYALASRRLERERTETRDALTGLPNRKALEARLNGPGGMGGARALVLVDLDDFKAINDVSGHALGDELLRGVAARLDAATRGSELLARIDGDAFAVLVEGSAAEAEAIDVVERIHSVLAEPLAAGGSDHQIFGSVGVALRGADDRASLADLARDAELAMYEAKRTRGNSVAVFAPEMHAAATERLELANDLRHAIEHDELRLQYQPIVNLASGQTLGYEALVRWSHPVRGPLSPAQFIPLAERTGLIVDLGRWVLEEACRQMEIWRAVWGDDRYVSVNVAGEQLESGMLVEQVDDALARSGLPPEALLLEVTESSLIANLDAGLDQMAQVRRRGVRFALDDFGTGYSSLSYLQRFPIDVLKVDKSFIDHVGERDGGALVQAIVHMARSLRMRVVAEGIEDEIQAQLLREMGCDLGQGYRFSRPLAAVDVPRTPAMLGGRDDLRLTG